MRIVGIIGGVSWESTLHYYKIMNQEVRERLGRHNSLESIIYSVNFEQVLEFVHKNEWEPVGKIIARAGKSLEAGGADFLIITSNATHKVFPQLAETVNIPVLHIVDPTARAIQKAGIRKIGLLGTQVTMQEKFYRDRLMEKFGIEAIVPEEEDRESIHSIIFDELTKGIVLDDSREKLLAMSERLLKRGAGGVILGCTELTLLIDPKDSPIPFFDTTDLHALAAVDLALS